MVLPLGSPDSPLTGGPRVSPKDIIQRRSLLGSYVLDWALLVGLAVGFYFVGKVAPYFQDFSLGDASLMHDMHPNSVTPAELAVICGVAPLVIILALTLPFRRWFNAHQGVLGLGLALVATEVITNSLKNVVGRPRPDFLSRCQVDMKHGTPTDPLFGLSTVSVCTQTDLSVLYDGFRSFPSGHSSLSFAGLGFLALFLAGKIHMMDRKTQLWKILIFLAPWVSAALVAASRVKDHRHRGSDVLAGAIIGAFCAWLAYYYIYPPLSSAQCDTPYCDRITLSANTDEFSVPLVRGSDHVAVPVPATAE